MKHRVFISHSSRDAQLANAICHYLEEAAIPCWIAPRDIRSPDWAAAIIDGIRGSEVFVVILELRDRILHLSGADKAFQKVSRLRQKRQTLA